MKKNHFISGEWNLICDVCSKKIKAHEARQRWDGFIVCPDDFENRHPQDFVKANTDKLTVPFVRPRPPDIFVDDGNRTVADLATIQEEINKRVGKVFIDMFQIDDSGQDYIDPTYFAEDYLGTITIELIVNKVLVDSTTYTDSGSLFHNSYIEETYFASDYVGTYTSF